MKKDKIAVGQVRRTNEGGWFTILKINSAKDIQIVHNDTHRYKTSVSACQVRSGTIRNPYHPTLYGFGYIGVGNYKSKIKRKAVECYTIWVGILARCYSKSRKLNLPSYIGCCVSEDWACYQNFAHWYTTHPSYGFGFEVDKDLLSRGERVYSESTCTLLPKELNIAIRVDRSKQSDYPVGVAKSKAGNFISRLTIKGERKSLGTFKTPEEASAAYIQAKEAYVKELAIKYEGQIEPRAFQALMSWTVY